MIQFHSQGQHLLYLHSTSAANIASRNDSLSFSRATITLSTSAAYQEQAMIQFHYHGQYSLSTLAVNLASRNDSLLFSRATITLSTSAANLASRNEVVQWLGHRIANR